MTNQYFEQLSALRDGELDASEARFLLRRMEHDLSLVNSWAHYEVTACCLRGEHVLLLGDDFLHGVQTRLAQEAQAMPATGTHGQWAQASAGGDVVAAPARRWTHWVGGMAVAASVAAIALTSFPHMRPSGPAVAPAVVADAPAASTPSVTATAGQADAVLAAASTQPRIEDARIQALPITQAQLAAPYRLDVQPVSLQSGQRQGRLLQADPRLQGWLWVTPDGRMMVVQPHQQKQAEPRPNQAIAPMMPSP